MNSIGHLSLASQSPQWSDEIATPSEYTRQLVARIERCFAEDIKQYNGLQLSHWTPPEISSLLREACKQEANAGELFKLIKRNCALLDQKEVQKELNALIENFIKKQPYNLVARLSGAAKDFIKNSNERQPTFIQNLAAMDNQSDNLLSEKIRLSLLTLSHDNVGNAEMEIYMGLLNEEHKDIRFHEALAKGLEAYENQPNQSLLIKKLFSVVAHPSSKTDFKQRLPDSCINKTNAINLDLLSGLNASEFDKIISHSDLRVAQPNMQLEKTHQKYNDLVITNQRLTRQMEALAKENEQLKEDNNLYLMQPKQLVKNYEKWRKHPKSAELISRIIRLKSIPSHTQQALATNADITQAAIGGINLIDLCLGHGSIAFADAFLNSIDPQHITKSRNQQCNDPLEQTAHHKSPPLTAEMLDRVRQRYETLFKKVEDKPYDNIQNKAKCHTVIQTSFLNWAAELYKNFQVDFTRGNSSEFIRHMPALLTIGAYAAQALSLNDTFLEDGESRVEKYDNHNKKIINRLRAAANNNYIHLKNIDLSSNQFTPHLKSYFNDKWQPINILETDGIGAPKFFKDALKKLHAELNPSP